MISGSTRIGLVERFRSIQGEGWNAGRSALFIRFAGCNLDCHFADGSVCDTPWQRAVFKPTVDEVLAWVDGEMSATSNPFVIFTGGEPLMAPAFPFLVDKLRKWQIETAVETNGTIWHPALAEMDWVVCSPKDRVAHRAPLRQDAAPHLQVLHRADEFRYIITRRDSPVPPKHNHHAKYYLSPALLADGSGMEARLGITPAFAPGAVDRCLEIIEEDTSWRLSLQTHKWIQVR